MRRKLVLTLSLALLTSVIVWVTSRPVLLRVDHVRFEARIRGKGGPAVIFESGLAGLAGGDARYEELQDRIAEQTETLTYERAGIGHSDAGPQPRTAEQIARELRALLGVAGIRPPVVLVCHSVGCLYTRVFAHDFPAETAAIVFIDPMTGSYLERAQKAAASGRDPEHGMSAGARREWAALPASLDEVRKAWPLPQVPCVVITALKPLGHWPLESRQDMDEWLKANQALVARLPDATHVVLPQATDQSALEGDQVAKAILDLVTRLRSTGR